MKYSIWGLVASTAYIIFFLYMFTYEYYAGKPELLYSSGVFLATFPVNIILLFTVFSALAGVGIRVADTGEGFFIYISAAIVTAYFIYRVFAWAESYYRK